MIVNTGFPGAVTLTIEVADPRGVLDRIRRVLWPTKRLVTVTLGPPEVAALNDGLRAWLDGDPETLDAIE